MSKINKNKDWTEPAHLGKDDWEILKKIKQLHEQGNMQEAMDVAMSTDTIVREEIPPQVWLDMGGRLTNAGWEKLRQERKQGQSKER